MFDDARNGFIFNIHYHTSHNIALVFIKEGRLCERFHLFRNRAAVPLKLQQYLRVLSPEDRHGASHLAMTLVNDLL